MPPLLTARELHLRPAHPSLVVFLNFAGLNILWKTEGAWLPFHDRVLGVGFTRALYTLCTSAVVDVQGRLLCV